MKIAWFSPFPPVRTGIAAVSAELVAALRQRGVDIDPYPEEKAHDFPWRQAQRPVDLIVYQFGNSSHHDYQWAYAFRYPGLVVLHDTHLHHARAAFLLREKRAADYRAEFRYNHPAVPADVAELAVAGFDNRVYYDWPMVRALVEGSRLTAVHGDGARRELLEAADADGWDAAGKIVSIRLGHGEPIAPERKRDARRRVRGRYAIADDAVLFVCAGGITPEKRVPQVLAAFHATLPHAPSARLLLAGPAASHYDAAAGIAALGLQDRVTVAGYIESDAELTDHLAASDVSLNLRWPTARETSGPWLRALAAGVATVITDLAHLGDVPSLDPRTWTLRDGGRRMECGGRNAEGARAVCVAVDILDEDHSLRLAMRRLATDAALRDSIAAAGQQYWRREHTLEAMADDYARVIAMAAERPSPARAWPPHLRNSADSTLRALLAPFGLENPLGKDER